MRLAPVALACTAALVLATRADATCMEVDCEESLTRADGSSFETDEGHRLRLRAGEPFVFRRKCDQVCNAPGGTPSRTEEPPRPPVVAVLGRNGMRCAETAPLRTMATDDRFAF